MGSKVADLAGPGIGNYAELEKILPSDYSSMLTRRETQKAIHAVKRFIEDQLCKELNLMMVTVPLIVDVESGVNDMLDRDGSRTPIQFHISNDRDEHPVDAQIVQAATKWKRMALKEFAMRMGEGLCTDMRAVRKDYFLDHDHSVYVDQWDWERVISPEERNLEFLKEIVGKIWNVLVDAELYAQELFPELRTKKVPNLPKKLTFLHAEELLKLVELQDAAKRKVSTYSGGMRRRLELACGLINYPKLLFLDEPTLGLDVQTRTVVWKYIKMLKDEYHMTLFLTTHYLEEADSLCDRIAIIDHGHIIRIGSPEELKESIGGDVIVVTLKETQPDISSEIANIKLVRNVQKNDNNYRIKVELGEEASPQITDLIRSKGLHVTKVSLTKPTLDEAYLELTGRNLREEEADRMQMFRQRITVRRARS